MRIVISSGHGKYVRGASGFLDEVNEARRVVDRVAALLRSSGVTVDVFHDDVSTSQNENLNRIVSFHNSKTRDLDISVHFNAYQPTNLPMGTECLYVTQQALADKVAEAIASVGFIDRGPKKRTDLFFLNNTTAPAILIETCFVDSKADETIYKAQFENICQRIAATVSGGTVQPGPEPEPTPPPADEVVGTVQGIPANDMLNIRAGASSSATIIGSALNGDKVTIVDQQGDWYKLKLTKGVGEPKVWGFASSDYIRAAGPVTPVGWHTDITATVFASSDDPQSSAYPPHAPIDGSIPAVSLPYKWRNGPTPTIEVKGSAGTRRVGVIDVGPWNTDDPDYVLGRARPLAEHQYRSGTKAQNGLVPTNDAGIDLTPALADAIGISGKGKVSWRIIEGNEQREPDVIEREPDREPIEQGAGFTLPKLPPVLINSAIRWAWPYVIALSAEDVIELKDKAVSGQIGLSDLLSILRKRA